MPDPNDEFTQPQLKPEQVEAYRIYREGGGVLVFQEWLDAGMPTVTEEKASIAWMSRLDTYLSNQIQTGNISKEEADLAWNDVQDRLFGAGKYVGKKQTVIELPAAIRGDVEQYWNSLPIERQRTAEQQAKAQQQVTQDIASQRAELPLNAGGTQTQQINAGQQAIRNLKIQMQAAPTYLQGQMQGQIAQLEESINQIASSVRLQTGQTTRAKEGTPEEPPQPGTMAQDFAKQYGMSPEAAQRTGYNYHLNPESPEYANLTNEQKGQLAWVGIEAAGPRPEPAPAPPYNPPAEFETSGETGSPVWKSWFARYYPSIVSQFTQEKGNRRTAENWVEFLTKERTRIKEQFTSQGAYSRAERPGYFAPKIKTVSFA